MEYLFSNYGIEIVVGMIISVLSFLLSRVIYFGIINKNRKDSWYIYRYFLVKLIQRLKSKKYNKPTFWNFPTSIECIDWRRGSTIKQKWLLAGGHSAEQWFLPQLWGSTFKHFFSRIRMSRKYGSSFFVPIMIGLLLRITLNLF